jgi:murein DD-endopeptidase MepM/ murein hydrolase activator NlpD
LIRTRARPAIVLVAALSLALATVPSRADTAGDLRAAKARLATLQAELDRLAASYAGALSDLARTDASIQGLSQRVAALRQRLARLQARLSGRARAVYEGGGADAVEMLLVSDSFSEFSDRVEFLDRLERADGDLLIQLKVTREALGRDERTLQGLSAKQAATVASLQRQRSDIAAAFAETQALEATLANRFAQQQSAAEAARRDSAPVHAGGVLGACPVGRPRAFVDTFGAPRPGGRTHQGIDLMAPFGTPIYAAQSGRFEQNENSLGGTSALVYAANGDFTYYAHMSSYAGVADGSTVTAGTMIGHVGNTGDARGGPYHLHFEYHPGGGAAVDPYSMLKAACG